VHGRLEGFHIDKDLVGRETPAGPISETLRPIFRDRLEFGAGGSLAEQTLAALDGSAAFIVLASPNAARSKYVNEELRQFKSHHPERPVIPLIVDGEPDDPVKECFPPALRFSVAPDGAITNTPVDVLAADLREKGDGIELALAKVVARLIGLAPDDVFRRADRERRRQARRTRRVQALIYVLLVGIIAGLIGWINQAYIKEQWNWFTVMRPYRVANFDAYALKPNAERALKPLTSFRECAKDCPEMIVIPAGSFTMGSPATEKYRYGNEGPQHKVTVSRPFAVSKFDVTFADWDACVSVGGCPQATDSGMGRDTKPVINVSWDDAQTYVAWLSKMTGQPYRLLTEAEWEYAARAGTTTAYYWGDEIGTGNANCNGCGSQRTHQSSPVGSFRPNAFGLYDMAGNVWQWVQDCWHNSYDGAPSDGSSWISGDCSRRVVRGGDWDGFPPGLRAAIRGGITTVGLNGVVGFRVGRMLSP
jgi:formylglycine-generating enzyme required for sulfatase activity